MLSCREGGKQMKMWSQQLLERQLRRQVSEVV